MPNNAGPNNNTSSDFLKVLLALKANILRDLKVASLAIVKKTDGDIATVETFPVLNTEREKHIECVIPYNITLKQHDVVLVLFLDRDFRQNLRQAKTRQKLTPLKENVKLHSEEFGIVLSIVYTEETNQEEKKEG